ncbi:hypothetical protein B0J13DRAFT_50915 [Dactylonectria estremocensis]|uniref:Uncharacterized protein n=1 Tax=Dactylonectria estremocensis TaxID=1079267 RepID=A0A9P9ERY1_9HYPO|nr:hypothetical protein B0J13DRAFT_50915 [Dactylonectria estremocensis]
MWIVGATAIRPLALDEMFEALCIPEEFTLGLDSTEDPLTHGESSIRAGTWMGFYRQLRLRCEPFLEVIIPQAQSGSGVRENIEISPRHNIQLLHRTIKDFLQNPSESAAVSFSEAEANLFVRESLRRYLRVVLPVHPCRYSPVPAMGNCPLEKTVQAMAKYLDKKNLLEFALTVLPEEEWLHHLLIFETSAYPPPPMDQREQWPWNQSLFDFLYQYFSYRCRQGLTVAVTNMLTIASILILSWLTSLRYGPLALAIKESSLTRISHELTERPNATREALRMVKTFSNREESLIWECQGVPPRSGYLPRPPPKVQKPSSTQLADIVAGFEASHGGKKGKKKDLSFWE